MSGNFYVRSGAQKPVALMHLVITRRPWDSVTLTAVHVWVIKICILPRTNRPFVFLEILLCWTTFYHKVGASFRVHSFSVWSLRQTELPWFVHEQCRLIWYLSQFYSEALLILTNDFCWFGFAISPSEKLHISNNTKGACKFFFT